MSADGNITGSYQYNTYGKKENLKLTKALDYSEVTAKYESGSAISWTGLWHITSYSYGATMMVQSGDTVKGYLGYNGMFEGTVSGNVLTAHFLPDQKVGSHITYVFTMSKDGKSLSVYSYYGNSGGPDDSKNGERISPITYTFATLNASGWAMPELDKAQAYGLIPDSLIKEDLKKPITRKEFAAVAVKLYENLTGKKAAAAAKNPFTDTNDAEVLKAYNVGITSGTSADKFSPNVLLNREQAATMLTRVLKGAYIEGWSLATDGDYTLKFTQPAKFADDSKISDWAKPSVYFMAANGVITGTGNNMFSPRAVTSAEVAANYASATRQEALIIAARMVDKLKGKTLDYSGSSAVTPTTPAVSGDLTLAEIKKAAEDAGYKTDNSKASTGDFEGTTPKPIAGFCIAGTDGSSTLNIYVNEFETAELASEYCDYVNSLKKNQLISCNAYKKFCVQFSGDAVDKEAALMAVFTSVGWGK